MAVVDTHTAVVNTHVLVSDVRLGVSELNNNVTNTNIALSNIHREILKREEGTDSQQRMVRDTHALCVTEQIFTTIQTQNRSAANKSARKLSFSHLNLAYLENPHPRHRGPSLDVTS